MPVKQLFLSKAKSAQCSVVSSVLTKAEVTRSHWGKRARRKKDSGPGCTSSFWIPPQETGCYECFLCLPAALIVRALTKLPPLKLLKASQMKRSFRWTSFTVLLSVSRGLWTASGGINKTWSYPDSYQPTFCFFLITEELLFHYYLFTFRNWIMNI